MPDLDLAKKHEVIAVTQNTAVITEQLKKLAELRGSKKTKSTY